MRVQTGRLFPITLDFACGSVVLFYLFQEIWHNVPNFLKETVSFHPAGGESGHVSRQMPGLEPTA